MSLVLSHEWDELLQLETDHWIVFLPHRSGPAPIKISLSQLQLVDHKGRYHNLQEQYYRDSNPPTLYLLSRSDNTVSIKLEVPTLRLQLLKGKTVIQYHIYNEDTPPRPQRICPSHLYYHYFST